jgi:hypothetical protein
VNGPDGTVNLRANTKAGDRSVLRQYLLPAFGSASRTG